MKQKRHCSGRFEQHELCALVTDRNVTSLLANLELRVKDASAREGRLGVLAEQRHVEDGEVVGLESELRESNTGTCDVTATCGEVRGVSATHSAVERLLLLLLVAAQRRAVARLHAAQIYLALLVIHSMTENVYLRTSSLLETQEQRRERRQRASGYSR